MIDLGTGNNNKMCAICLSCPALKEELTFLSSNWAMDNKQEVCSHALNNNVILADEYFS